MATGLANLLNLNMVSKIIPVLSDIGKLELLFVEKFRVIGFADDRYTTEFVRLQVHFK